MWHTRWFALLIFVPGLALAAELHMGARSEITHHGTGHDVHLSGPTVAVTPDGGVLVGWIAQEPQGNQLYLHRVGVSERPTVRVNPVDLPVESLHQPPGIAVGRTGDVYVSWASSKAKPEGTFFASDLRLSRSVDGGASFEPPLRLNEDRPISHSFEGLAVAADGTVVVAWIDSREGPQHAGTYLTRLTPRGTQIERPATLDRATCVCCRVDVTTSPPETVVALWRTVLPGNIRDMVLGLSRDGGRTFEASNLIHADGWRIAACPHRGGMVRSDAQGRLYLSWYTEGTTEEPRLLLTVSTDGQHFAAPTRLDTSTTSIPDHPRLAVDPTGRAVIVWEDATAVRRRVLLRSTVDAGKTLSPIHTVSQAIKAYAPDVAVSPAGGFVVVWHEEQFPQTKTIIQHLRIDQTP